VPELPDVEGFKRYFARHAAGREVRGVEVPAPAIVRNSSAAGLGRALHGRRFERPSRVGKWMVARTGGPALVFHFGMTGFLVWSRDAGDRHRHDRLILDLGDGELRYRNMRMLGGVWLCRDEDELERVTGPLGPDADGLDRDGWAEILGAARGGLKGLLMNQRRIAGIGNELSDEILWRARLHPLRQARSLDRREVGRLARAAHEIIATSNRHGRIPTEARWLKSQRRSRDPRCPRCRTDLRRDRIAGRTAFWCPRCQRSWPRN
jgi:formamidopyrimidine-DNA glycosylase